MESADHDVAPGKDLRWSADQGYQEKYKQWVLEAIEKEKRRHE